MSLFGKILALLNMFGAVGLVYIAMLDYGKRQALAYNYFRHELTLNGLPLSDAERDAQNQPIVDRLGDELPKELFSSLGNNPISTQVEEVQRVKSGLDGKIQAATTIAQKSRLLARMLLPLADNYLEREQLLACRVHLASEATVAALKKRCEDAFREAKRSVAAKGADKEDDPPKPKSVREAFRLAFRSQGGPPADYFVSLLLTALPDDLAKAEAAKIDAIFDSALEIQRAGLEKRYTQLFSDALGTQSTQSDTASSTAAQKGAIARLLFGLSVFLAEEEVPGGPATNPKMRNALIESEPYRINIRRLYVVCGLRSSLESISERASVVRRLSNYVQQSVGQERQQFLFDHTAILEQLREQAGVVRDEQLRIIGNAKKLEDYSELVRLRTKEISDLTADLQKSRGQTKEETSRLRDQSENVLQLRVRVRDAIRDNERGEKRIRELEKQVRELEK